MPLSRIPTLLCKFEPSRLASSTRPSASKSESAIDWPKGDGPDLCDVSACTLCGSLFAPRTTKANSKKAAFDVRQRTFISQRL